MKKIISIIICLSMIASSLICVFADDKESSKNVILSENELAKKVEELNTLFPDAELKFEDYVAFQENVNGMAADERVEFFNSLTGREEFETYQSCDGNSILRVYAPGATSLYGKNLGTYVDNGSYESYIGTKVYLDQLWGYINIYAHYNVNHDYISETGTGYVRYRGDFSFRAYVHYIITTYILLNSMFVSPLGSSQAVLQSELTTVDFGLNSEPTYIETIKLIFDASNFSAQLWEGPSHLA